MKFIVVFASAKAEGAIPLLSGVIRSVPAVMPARNIPTNLKAIIPFRGGDTRDCSIWWC